MIQLTPLLFQVLEAVDGRRTYDEIAEQVVEAIVNTARTELCRGGKCQAVIFKDHSHMSSVFSPNTEDTTVTGPILKWMQGVK